MMLAGAVTCLLGAVCCFSGYRLLRFLLAVLGFLVGMLVTSAIGFALFELQDWLSLIVGLIGGVAGALLSLFLYTVGIFLLGCVAGISLTSILAPHLPADPAVLSIVLAILGGVLALLLQKVLLIGVTAVVGAWVMLVGLGMAIGRFDPQLWYETPSLALVDLNWFLIPWLILFVLGVATQMRRGKRESRDAVEERS
jgi:hypothetical protein